MRPFWPDRGFGREPFQKARKTRMPARLWAQVAHATCATVNGQMRPCAAGANLLFAEINELIKGVPMSPDGKVHHETVHYSGRVQGVGFRYTTLLIARGYEVSGFVQNLADGRVCLEVEGEKNDVNAFLAAVEERMQGLMREVERAAEQRPRQFNGFAIH
jgi:acylphosphatase